MGMIMGMMMGMIMKGMIMKGTTWNVMHNVGCMVVHNELCRTLLNE